MTGYWPYQLAEASRIKHCVEKKLYSAATEDALVVGIIVL